MGTTSPPAKENLPLDYQSLQGNTPQTRKINPAFFIPVLYVMQGMPVTTVQEMFAVTWKDLHVANPLIVSWISLLSLPWTWNDMAE